MKKLNFWRKSCMLEMEFGQGKLFWRLKDLQNKENSLSLKLSAEEVLELIGWLKQLPDKQLTFYHQTKDKAAKTVKFTKTEESDILISIASGDVRYAIKISPEMAYSLHLWLFAELNKTELPASEPDEAE